jgi:hypothetical protein
MILILRPSHLIGAEFAHVAPDFHQGLREAGFVDGQSVAIEFRVYLRDCLTVLGASAQNIVPVIGLLYSGSAARPNGAGRGP